MNPDQSFHDVRFPTDIALGASGGPVRRTEIVSLGSGKEQRNSRWKHSRRKYNVGYGVKTASDLYRIVEFFEERSGRLYGFRFKDQLDHASAPHGNSISFDDQQIGIGNGVAERFRLTKQYGGAETGYVRNVLRPVEHTIVVAVNGQQINADGFSFDFGTGEIVFNQETLPPNEAVITAGFEFDVPVRFDTDEIAVNMAHFQAGNIPSIPLVELV